MVRARGRFWTTVLGVVLTGLTLTSLAQGAEDAPDAFRAPRANVLAASFAVQGPINFDKDLPLGGGIFYTREYFVTPRVALGIHVGTRVFPTPPFQFALGYGLSIKHYLGNFGETQSSGLYLLYGLLVQMSTLEGRSGSGTGHDTKMAVGYDCSSTRVSPVFELGYHLTQVRAFDADTIWWPYTELAVGLRF